METTEMRASTSFRLSVLGISALAAIALNLILIFILSYVSVGSVLFGVFTEDLEFSRSFMDIFSKDGLTVLAYEELIGSTAPFDSTLIERILLVVFLLGLPLSGYGAYSLLSIRAQVQAGNKACTLNFIYAKTNIAVLGILMLWLPTLIWTGIFYVINTVLQASMSQQIGFSNLLEIKSDSWILFLVNTIVIFIFIAIQSKIKKDAIAESKARQAAMENLSDKEEKAQEKINNG